MARKYNGLNSLNIDLAKSGICKDCGRRFTDPLCTHATPEQIAATIAMDAEAYASYGPQEPPSDPRIFNRRRADGTYPPLSEFFDNHLDPVPEPTKTEGETMAEESDRISRWLSDHWDEIPEVPF